MLTTALRRLVLPVFLFFAWTPVAQAWSWPVQGPVLQPFSYDEAHPYASGQHRGIDIGADAAGQSVVAPAAGTVSFAGTVPTNGKSLTIETPDGYSVTLTHLGSVLVGKGAAVTEGGAVGTIGPSGTPEFDQPYVHLGIRLAADPNGYLDPVKFLPPAPPTEPAQSAPPASQATASSGVASNPASTPPPATHVAVVRSSRTRTSRVDSRPRRSVQRPAVHAADADARASGHTSRTQRRPSEAKTSTRRPVVEVAAPVRRAALGAGHEIRPSAPVAHVQRPRPRTSSSSVLLALACNGAAALVALLAAFAARRRRRLLPRTGAQVLHLPPPVPARRAA